MQAQIQNLGPNGRQDVANSLSAAQSELSKLRNQFPSSGSTGDMPDFQPKETRTKSFLKRIEYGVNVQTAKSNYYFPATTDFAFTLGYKISDANNAGVGLSYKMGWGTGIRHIHITSEGLSLRSFLNIKIKGSFFASGGFEYNYQQPFHALRELYDLQSWQKSGLIGISKTVSLKTKFFKKTSVQVLWDMLSYSQVPKAEPIKIRVGNKF